MSRHSVSTMIERLKKRAGVNGYGGDHRLRHYFATRYLDMEGKRIKASAGATASDTRIDKRLMLAYKI